jgi:hypothetical protein
MTRVRWMFDACAGEGGGLDRDAGVLRGPSCAYPCRGGETGGHGRLERRLTFLKDSPRLVYSAVILVHTPMPHCKCAYVSACVCDL